MIADAEVADEEDVVSGLFHSGPDRGEFLRRPREESVEIHHRFSVPLRIVRMFSEEVEHPLEFLHLLCDGGFDVEADSDLKVSPFGGFQHGVQRVGERALAAAFVCHDVGEEAVDSLRFGEGELPLPVFHIASGRVLQREVVVVDRGEAGVERRVPRSVVGPGHFPIRNFRPVSGGGDGERQSSRTECC
ncbi:hypothetical protein SDC9_187808 [bioreactor metagenome]|uniref:Uncharacterized protein n=1 Tax=bioreactor metagenome TaxID=1076179 RepID=A0A645HP80_9ZZZZ